MAERFLVSIWGTLNVASKFFTVVPKSVERSAARGWPSRFSEVLLYHLHRYLEESLVLRQIVSIKEEDGRTENAKSFNTSFKIC